MAGMPKTVCPVSREQFKAKAQAIEVKVGEKATLIAAPREFETDSLGYYVNDKITMMIDGKPVVCTAQIQIIAVGSKELPGARTAEEKAAAKAAKAAK